MDPIETCRTFWRTLDARDWEGFAACLTDDVTGTWPQSRERVRGRDALVRFMREYPGDWNLTLTAAYAGDAGVATRVAFVSGRSEADGGEAGAPEAGLTYFTFDEEGRISALEEYWPEPYEPPAGREHLLERY